MKRNRDLRGKIAAIRKRELTDERERERESKTDERGRR